MASQLDLTLGIASYNALRYSPAMIQGFADSEAELIWSGRRSRKLPADIQNVALRKLRLLNQARVLGDLRVPPGSRLEALRADRQGQHSIRINDQWRCFVWDDGGPSHVEIVDYHV
jgi:toxin HigB-1